MTTIASTDRGTKWKAEMSQRSIEISILTWRNSRNFSLLSNHSHFLSVICNNPDSIEIKYQTYMLRVLKTPDRKFLTNLGYEYSFQHLVVPLDKLNKHQVSAKLEGVMQLKGPSVCFVRISWPSTCKYIPEQRWGHKRIFRLGICPPRFPILNYMVWF